MKTKLIASLLAASAVVAGPVQAETTVTTAGGLKVQTGKYKFEFGGRIMYDYNKAELNGVTDEDDFDLRRGRVYAKGNVSKNWGFKTQFNVDGSGAEDLYLQYTGWGSAAKVTIGNQNMPFGLELLTSSKDISVLERSAITERYAIGRAEGVQLHGALGKKSSYGIGVFGDDTADSEIGFAARYTYAPVLTDTSVIHLGVAYKDIADDRAVGFEAAASSGPFHIQAEFVDGEEGNTDIDGYYVQAGYIRTGASRPYKGGVFKRVTPGGNEGAWELTARYEDGDGNFSDIELGTTDASAYTLGLNYYPHKNVRIGANYTDGESNVSDDDGSEFRIRFQLTF